MHSFLGLATLLFLSCISFKLWFHNSFLFCYMSLVNILKYFLKQTWQISRICENFVPYIQTIITKKVNLLGFSKKLLMGLILGSSFIWKGRETLQNQKTGWRGLLPYSVKNLYNTEWIREPLHQDKWWPVCKAGETMLKGKMLSSCVHLFLKLTFPLKVLNIFHVIHQFRKKKKGHLVT